MERGLGGAGRGTLLGRFIVSIFAHQGLGHQAVGLLNGLVRHLVDGSVEVGQCGGSG